MRALVCLAAAAVAAPVVRAQATPLEAPPAGIVETGAPSFVVLGPEALGLTTAPTDLHQMPDGRILAVAQNELALGDGVRWEVIREVDDGEQVNTASVAVDRDGRIYAGTRQGFARIEFGADGRWRFHDIAPMPPDENPQRPIFTQAVWADGAWYWHCGSGALVSWQPGQEARIVGRANNISRVFDVGGRVYISDRTDGSLMRIERDGMQAVIAPKDTTASSAVTCAAPFEGNAALLGTNAEGLRLYDGQTFRRFGPETGLLAGGQRINDLCATGSGNFAAAVDAVGIVLFDRTGRVIQVLDRSLDHRLSRVQRLYYTPGGVLWALLHGGLARVQFPARVSHFESFVTTGLVYAQPIRHAGRLWLLADGRIQRGLYGDSGRLERFADASPPGKYVFSASSVTDSLLASNDAGLFRWQDETWKLVAPGLANARLEVPSVDGRRWLYVARDEVGWIHEPGGAVRVQRFPRPELGDVYASIMDGRQRVWLELGTSRIGLLNLQDDQLALTLFGPRDGVADGWVNIFMVDGVARFNVANRVFRFDEAARRFVEDAELLRRYPALASIVGRPARDARGRLWITTPGSVHVVDDRNADPGRSAERIPAGFVPYLFQMEKGGVVWMHEAGRLARFDPAMPQPPESPLRAVITQVTVAGTNRTLFDVGDSLGRLHYTENSLNVRFMAPGNPFGEPVSFDVKLAGADNDWVSTGSSGTAAFNRLKEGRYTLHVRPVAGRVAGAEATLSFEIEPPWYHTNVAYVVYALAAVALVLGIAGAAALLERREKERLERVVAVRTRELNETNLRLARQVEATTRKADELQQSEDRYRRLNEELEQRVEARTAELHGANELLATSNRELEAFSYSVSHDLRAPLRNISGFADLLRKRTAGKLDPEGERFLSIVAQEAVRLGQLIDSLLAFSRLSRAELRRQTISLGPLIDAVRNELRPECEGRVVEWRIGVLPEVEGDATLVRQVLANLIGNALKFTRPVSPAVIEVGFLAGERGSGERVFFVRDNGVGFDPKYTEKLFGVFQRLHTNREYEGTGIGLANVRRIISRHGGRVWAEGSVGGGATFYFTLPSRRPLPAAPAV